MYGTPRSEGYTVAASTGFCRVWEGASALTSLLESDDFPLRDKLAGKRVLELGAGVGLCGIAAAVAGAHVCVSDLRPVVDGVLATNVALNAADEVRSIHWLPYDRVGVVNADP